MSGGASLKADHKKRVQETFLQRAYIVDGDSFNGFI
jgi:hypothetical protein